MKLTGAKVLETNHCFVDMAPLFHVKDTNLVLVGDSFFPLSLDCWKKGKSLGNLFDPFHSCLCFFLGTYSGIPQAKSLVRSSNPTLSSVHSPFCLFEDWRTKNLWPSGLYFCQCLGWFRHFKQDSFSRSETSSHILSTTSVALESHRRISLRANAPYT